MDVGPVTEFVALSTIAAIVIYALRRIVRLYSDWKRLPPGPFPLPLIGNILCFRQNKFAHEVMNDLSTKYGPVFTIFLGHMPNIVITDPAIGLKVLKKHTFAGRPQTFLDKVFFKDDSTDIVFADFGKEWEALRKVGHSAARKYAVSPRLAHTVTDVVDRVIARFKEQPTDSETCFNLMMIGLLGEAAFGKKYDFDDEEFRKWMTAMEVQQRQNSVMMLVMFLPFMRFILLRQWQEFTWSVKFQNDYVEKMYEIRLANYKEGKDDTFTDAIITAKMEAEADENWMQPYLKKQNILNTIIDLFGAGIETTKVSLRWLILMMAKYPQMQELMRKEVQDFVADQDPQLHHKSECHFVCAFISETMRFKPIVPVNVPHKATVDCEIEGHQIPAGMPVLVSLHNQLQDEVWIDPQTFRPERFLDANGMYVSKPNPYFIPFSEGRRSCPGNKLAFNNLFLIVVRLLQKTQDIQVVGGVTDSHMRGDLSRTQGVAPIPYQLQLSLRQKDRK